MSIDSEVTSMTQNIQADYEGLENIGADLTGINKNIQNIRTILDTIYNDLPKVTGEGTEVTLTPTRKGRLALIPKGNSEQGQKKSPNLYNVNDFLSGQDYSVDSEGFITLAYDNTAGSSTRTSSYYTNNLDIQASTTYLLVAEIKSVSGEGTIYFTNRQGNSNQGQFPNFYKQFSQLSNGEILTEQITSISAESMVSVARGLRTLVTFVAGQSGSITFRLSVLADTTITPQTFHYLPFGNLDPQPYFQIPIKSVTGNNNVVVNNKNICTSTNITGYNRNLRFYFDNKLLANTFTLSFITNEDLSNQTLTIQDETTSTNIAQFSSAVTGTANTKVTVTKTLTNEQLQAIQNTSDTICMIIYKGTANFTSITEAQIENNSTNTTYEAYTQVTKPLNLGTIELNKIGNYQDYIYKNNDKWYKKEVIGKVVLDGTENWAVTGSAFQVQNALPSDMVTVSNSLLAYCNYFTYHYYQSSITTNIKNGEFGWNSRTYLTMRNDTYTTKNEFTEWLGQVKPIIKYQKATATDIEITDTSLIEQLEEIDKMKSYNGTTIITSTYEEGNAQMILSASGLKGE